MNIRKNLKSFLWASFFLLSFSTQASSHKKKIGVLYATLAGFSYYSEHAAFDSSIQIFSYDENSMVYKTSLWNPIMWPLVLEVPAAKRQMKKYEFEYQLL